MASNLELVRSRLSMRERLIVALDVDHLENVKQLVRLLAPEVGMFKVGKQLFTCAGPQAVRLIHEIGGEVFLDLKFHDIPTTVAKAAVEATRLGVKMFNVHASGSLEMMRATVKEVRRIGRQEKRRQPIMQDRPRLDRGYVFLEGMKFLSRRIQTPRHRDQQAGGSESASADAPGKPS